MTTTTDAPWPAPTAELEASTAAMGGTLHVRVACAPDQVARAERDLLRVAERVRAWSHRLSRFDETSDLCRLNAQPERMEVPLRPTLATVLEHARAMGTRTGGAVDVTLLDQRLAAEHGGWSAPLPARAWRLAGDTRRRTLVRGAGSRFDLDGVAKGWIADRALRLLAAYPGALVDADGDIALRAQPALGWRVAISHPVDGDVELACLAAPDGREARGIGIATSGTSVHRWHGPGGPSHHLLDPGTGRPALTDVVQATVVAEDAAAAECLAKAAVILGSDRGLEILAAGGALAAVLLLEGDEVRAMPGTSRWLA